MRKSLLYTSLILSLLALGCGERPNLEADASHPPAGQMALRWEVLDNHQDGGHSFSSRLTLINNSTVPLDRTGWTLYFNFLRTIFPESLPDAVEVTHINGDFYQLTPTDAFIPLAPGDSLVLPFDAANWAISESDAPAGFYLVFTDDQGVSAPPEPVATVHVQPFLTRRQTDRQPGDRIVVSTPAIRYRQNDALTLLPADRVDRIVPSPVRIETGDGHWILDRSVAIHYEAGLETEARYLASVLEPLLGTNLNIFQDTAPSSPAIVLKTGSVSVNGFVKAPGDEAYHLRVDPRQGVEITGSDRAGVLYGIQSLRALLPVTAYRQPREAITVDQVRIEDAPRFAYRGMHLDVARHFQSKEIVKKLLDLMAFYKLNKFHFHLTDDEGWRLEIDGLPELTQVGGRRGHTLDERDHLVPSFGSGPDPDRSYGSGYYARADFVEILQYARERHIEVIPEIDVPGHARAAIKAMDARYARLMQEGDQAQADAFLLRDPTDASTYRSVQGWNDNVINVCRASTYHFLRTVIDAVAAMYDEAGVPLKTLHTGGDEVPRGVWEASPACASLIEENDEVESPQDLPAYFLHHLIGILEERGLATAGWEEIALTERDRDGRTFKAPNEAFLDRRVIPYVWNNVWGWGAEDVVYKLANAGYDVVMSNATNLYFDLAYAKDPQEPGYYWAGFVDTRKPFVFAPFDLFKSAEIDLMGNLMDPEASFANHVRLMESGRRHILGIQGQLWGENAKGRERMEYLVFPKLLGRAERAWAAQPAWATIEDHAERNAHLARAWNRFANALGQRELPRLDYLYGGVRYRLPPPGAVKEGGLLKANVAFPGLAIHYTTDGSEPTIRSPRYTEPLAVDGPVTLRAFDMRGRGGRAVVVSN